MKYIFTSGLFILLLDIIVLLLHISLGTSFSLFYIDAEYNVPTLFQGTKLLLIAHIAFLILFVKSQKKNLNKKELISWIIFGLIFFFLGIDEIGQIHENLPRYLSELIPRETESYKEFFSEGGFNSADWLIFYIPAYIIFIAYMLYFSISLMKKGDKRFILLIVGSILILFVPIIELINTSGIEYEDYPFYYFLLTLEETLEMIGASFFFIFAFQYLREILKGISIKEKTTS